MPDQSTSAPAYTQSLSRELQIGKAAEHLVCADLILQGHSAFLADQGLPYDVVVDFEGQLFRIQVKSTLKPTTIQGRTELYSFSTRRAKKSKRAAGTNECDFYAFVILDLRRIAYLPVSSLIGASGEFIVQCINFRSNASEGKHNGNSKDHSRRTRRIEDFSIFGKVP